MMSARILGQMSFLEISAKVFCSRATLRNARQCSTASSSDLKKTVYSDKRSLYHTTIDDPTKHTSRLEGLFYTVQNEHFKRWMAHGLMPHFYKCSKSFGEACVMIRKPALEIANTLSLVNEKLPVLKFIIYGRDGCGKSTTMVHILHHVGIQDWVVVHVPWAPDFNRNVHHDHHLSSYSKEPRLDQPTSATGWLKHFRNMNEPVIKKYDIKTTKNYVWTKRDESAAGTSLLELMEFALTRPKYATDVMGIVLRELKLQCNEGKFKTLVAIDGINSLWEHTVFKQEADRKKNYLPEQLSTIHFFRKLIASDWNNAAIIGTVDGNACSKSNSRRYLPQDVLQQQGFESLDPFLPIHVDDYTDREFHSCLQYFFDHLWYINPHCLTKSGIAEIQALSCKNPKEVYNLGVWM